MKAAILYESLTGHTRTAAELVAADLQQEGWGITGVSPVRRPDLLSVQDADGRVGIDYGVYGVPETYVIDKAGVIRFKHVGPVTPEVLNARLLPLIRELQR